MGRILNIYGVGMVVRIYTATWKCLDRKKAMKFFDRNGIPYIEYDLTNDRKALEDFMKKTDFPDSIKSLPVIEIDGNIIHGFDLEKIKVALKRNGFG